MPKLVFVPRDRERCSVFTGKRQTRFPMANYPNNGFLYKSQICVVCTVVCFVNSFSLPSLGVASLSNDFLKCSPAV